jgi:hypothetical protein
LLIGETSREVLGARFGNKANKVGWNGLLVGDKLLILNAGGTDGASIDPGPWWATNEGEKVRG